MNEQVVAYADPIVTWLKTTGLVLGMRVAFALAILLAGGLLIQLMSAALKKTLGKTKIGQQSSTPNQPLSSMMAWHGRITAT